MKPGLAKAGIRFLKKLKSGKVQNLGFYIFKFLHFFQKNELFFKLV